MTTIEKIKAEIEAVEPKSHVQYGMRWADSTLMIPFHKVMQIIDKYAEQEPNIDMECDEIKNLQKRSYLEGFHEAHKMLVKQESCDDVVSRQAVDDYIVKLLSGYLYAEERERLEKLSVYLWELPPVTQKSETVTEFADRCRECGARYGKLLKQATKTGKWEEIVKEHKCYARDDTYTTTEYHCSECGAEPFENEDGFYELSNYCPNCGCRMVEPTCDTCEYNTAAFMPCNACEDKSEYKPQESEDKDKE